MKHTCSFCETESKDVEGREVWGREVGFYELMRLQHDGSHIGYYLCSKKCVALLLRKLMASKPETKPAGKPSRTWKCEQCGAVLPQHIYYEDGECETAPTAASKLVYPNEWEYHYFCSDACLLAHLEDSEIITAVA